jgi:hypothetical protein
VIKVLPSTQSVESGYLFTTASARKIRICRRAGDVFVLPTLSEKATASRPEPKSAGRTIVAAPYWAQAPRWWRRPVLAPVSRRVILLLHTGRDAPALTDRQAVLLRPGPDITAALTAR